MRIMVISSNTQSLIWHRLDMMKSFLEQGHTVVAVGSDDVDIWNSVFEKEGLTYRSIPVQRNGLNPFKDFETLLELRKIIKVEKPNKIFAYQAKSIVYGSIAAKLNNINDFYTLFAGLGSIYRATNFKNKIVKLVMKAQYKIACKYSKMVFFHNKEDRNEFVQKGMTSMKKTVVLNGSGVNLDYFVPVEQPKKIKFLFIGRLIKDKGIMEYLEACKNIKVLYPEIRCILVGPFDSNPSAIKKEELTPYLETGIIEYYGEQKDVRPYIAQCSTVVLPSYHEGTPKAILEAMAMNRSIITTNAVGCRETVENGVNGFLVEVGNVNSLVNAMEKIINNPQMSVEMGKESLRMAQIKYDARLVNKAIIDSMGL